MDVEKQVESQRTLSENGWHVLVDADVGELNYRDPARKGEAVMSLPTSLQMLSDFLKYDLGAIPVGSEGKQVTSDPRLIMSVGPRLVTLDPISELVLQFDNEVASALLGLGHQTTIDIAQRLTMLESDQKALKGRVEETGQFFVFAQGLAVLQSPGQHIQDTLVVLEKPAPPGSIVLCSMDSSEGGEYSFVRGGFPVKAGDMAGDNRYDYSRVLIDVFVREGSCAPSVSRIRWLVFAPRSKPSANTR
ncbi:MAG: hypothetical protein JNK15_12610 [Planctomycetes bacterium]|nr:hypothetical protein [Planctomycetota bacterium]